MPANTSSTEFCPAQRASSRRLLYEALELSPGERQQWIGRIEDPSIRAEIKSLLRAEEGVPDSAINSAIQSAADRFSEPLLTGQVLGKFKLISILGTGGMGAVYKAEQTFPEGCLALKVIRPGLATPAMLRRFQQETLALGRLQHSGIAQIYEAGTADTGFGTQPYFSMELIHGRPLVDADQNRLRTVQRMELMDVPPKNQL